MDSHLSLVKILTCSSRIINVNVVLHVELGQQGEIKHLYGLLVITECGNDGILDAVLFKTEQIIDSQVHTVTTSLSQPCRTRKIVSS